MTLGADKVTKYDATSPTVANYQHQLAKLYLKVELFKKMLLTLKVRPTMTVFIIKKLPYNLTSNTGLALAGQIMKRLPIGKAFDGKFPVGTAGVVRFGLHGFRIIIKNNCQVRLSTTFTPLED